MEHCGISKSTIAFFLSLGSADTARIVAPPCPPF